LERKPTLSAVTVWNSKIPIEGRPRDFECFADLRDAYLAVFMHAFGRRTTERPAGPPDAQDILVSIRLTRNDHPPGSVYAIMRTLGSCGDDDGCAMQVSPSGREVPGVPGPQGLPVRQKGVPFRLPETQTASRRAPGSAGNPRHHVKSEAAFLIRWPVVVQKSPCARQDGRDGQKALPRGTTSRGFSRPKMPETCLRSHGKGVWHTCVPRPIFLATSFCDATRHTTPKTL
jgi:hypothetical protein